MYAGPSVVLLRAGKGRQAASPGLKRATLTRDPTVSPGSRGEVKRGQAVLLGESKTDRPLLPTQAVWRCQGRSSVENRMPARMPDTAPKGRNKRPVKLSIIVSNLDSS